MSSINTRCPSCSGLNKIPTDRISESPKCGKCQALLLDGAPIEGTSSNIDALLQSDQPVVIDFWAPWCNPCVGFSPVFEQSAADKQGQVRHIKINTEDQQELAAKYRIRSIPTIMVFKGGKQVDMINGALPKSQFDQWLSQAVAQ
ncbi:thioredoxin TrxC [Vibrio genomosp. F10]|uniref:Thioredoxin n=2 Tax=Vibrio genomosp. F10 TaxID=723171 RepID=A0A1B9R317_9VIBR|nr:thioredoxin TrxC [Vibrio genomosp. F10]OCH78683.1 thioredoxin TrxC [Vibrio genomosp. F10]OEE38142.1 thioredoxin TrxC [Vibrio genomosp. F10 str. ZF-129]OEE95482.1 thioredoxin TrxC [Vibrio genomosp. F10 str. 9ZD137]OEE97065.1 thioredoxin TrxC [Vibrio genomosp. F10 str. 9ZC157]OEF04813.1 thioredoxin TrxC [Vibrio genomosp. F10 str. 9ZB36]